MKERFKLFLNEHIEQIHTTFKVILYSFGIIGTLEFLLEGSAFLTGTNDQLAWTGFDIYLDWFFLLPAILHFYLYHKEKLPLFAAFTTSLSMGLFLKHTFVSTDPNFGWSKYVGFGIGSLVALYFSYLLFPKSNTHKQNQVIKQDIQPAPEVNYGLYPLKLDAEGKVRIPTEVLDLHTHIMGGTGSGKTRFAMFPWIYQTIVEHRIGCLVIDVKADMFRNLHYYSVLANRTKEFLYFDLYRPEISLRCNPLAEGEAAEIASRLFKALYHEPETGPEHYRLMASSVLNNLISLLKKEYPIINFQMIYECLNDMRDMKELKKLCAKYKDTNEATYFEGNWISKSLKEKQEQLIGLLNRLERFCNRPWAPLVNSLTPDILFQDVVNNGKILYFGISGIKYPDDAKALSVIALLCFSESLSDRFVKKPEAPFRVFLDEFYNMVNKSFTDTINKARGAKIEYFICHQDFSDLSSISKEFARQLSASARNKVLFGIDDPETAEYESNVFGTVPDKDTKVFSFDTRETLIARPAGYTMPDGRKFRVGPDDIKELPLGYAFVKIRFDHAPQYYMLQMMDCLAFEPPKTFTSENLIPVRNNHKLKVEGLKKEVREDLLTGRTPRAKPDFTKLKDLAKEQEKKKPKPPAKEEDNQEANG